MTESDDDLDRRVDRLLKAVGDRFKQARTDADVGPVPLAEAAGISRTSLYELEDGGNLKLRTFLRAVLALGLHPADLFEDRPGKVTEVTAALAALLNALPPDIRQAAEELAADLADSTDR
ncbi:helix-turn-helix domain-containing protein (plasmid) [Lentzea sp. JNUCC 0626]|uniref:helix-turn-helix domain-containing protein n=1 Tax=Lentzea sp. JNUCC 0626 TaxID=3367513 RepID=UPI0037483CA8